MRKPRGSYGHRQNNHSNPVISEVQTQASVNTCALVYASNKENHPVQQYNTTAPNLRDNSTASIRTSVLNLELVDQSEAGQHVDRVIETNIQVIRNDGSSTRCTARWSEHFDDFNHADQRRIGNGRRSSSPGASYRSSDARNNAHPYNRNGQSGSRRGDDAYIEATGRNTGHITSANRRRRW